jgi:DNA-binding MarR family transcriptional regulator
MLGTMLRFVRVVSRRFREAGGLDLTLSDLSVLSQVERGVDLPSAIADTLYLDRPRVSRITDQLVAQGYLERAVDLEDRRRSRLSLTESGARLLAEGRRHVVDATDSLLGQLSGEERRRITEGMASVRPLLDRESGS